MRIRQTAEFGSFALVALVALILAAGLVGCGSDRTDGEFQEYGALDSAAADGTEGGSSQIDEMPQVSPDSDGNPDAASAFDQPPVKAPVPRSDAGTSTVVSTDGTQDNNVGVSNPGSVVASYPGTPLESAEPEPREIKVLVPDRDFEVAGPEEALRVSFDDIDLLKVINMEPVTADAPEHMPDWLKDLDGKRIRIRGYMYPAFTETGIAAFLIARDTQTCCFGADAKLYDRFLVRMRKGVTTDYIHMRPFDVAGVFHIKPTMLDGGLYQLYEIDDAIVIRK